MRRRGRRTRHVSKSISTSPRKERVHVSVAFGGSARKLEFAQVSVSSEKLLEALAPIVNAEMAELLEVGELERCVGEGVRSVEGSSRRFW